MSENVVWELQYMAVTVSIGAMLALIYDFFRIARRVVKHNTLFIAIEDILFWMFCGIVIFIISFMENDGSFRGYNFFMVALGAYFYSQTISKILVKVISEIFKYIYKILSLFLKLFLKNDILNIKSERGK